MQLTNLLCDSDSAQGVTYGRGWGLGLPAGAGENLKNESNTRPSAPLV